MPLVASGAPFAVKRKAVEPVNKVKTLPVEGKVGCSKWKWRDCNLTRGTLKRVNPRRIKKPKAGPAVLFDRSGLSNVSAGDVEMWREMGSRRPRTCGRPRSMF
jgi:hypothetical protein